VDSAVHAAEEPTVSDAARKRAEGGPAAAEPLDAGQRRLRAQAAFRRFRVRTALHAAVRDRCASEIFKLCKEAEAMGVAESTIREARAVALEVRAASAYECAMQDDSDAIHHRAWIIHCFHYAPHLNAEQTASLENRLGQEVLSLMRKRDWKSARALLFAAEGVGVCSIRNAECEKGIAVVIEETHLDEALEDDDADAISEACEAIEERACDQDLPGNTLRGPSHFAHEMTHGGNNLEYKLSMARKWVKEIRARTACARCACSRRYDRRGERLCWCDACPDGCVLAGPGGKLRPYLGSLTLRERDDAFLAQEHGTAPAN
jgi:hypothetical protein